MIRIDRYWKRAAAGLLTATMLLAGGGRLQMESFAMAAQPFKGQALTSPSKIIVADEGGSQEVQNGMVQATQNVTIQEAQNGMAQTDQNGTAQTSGYKTAAFGEVTTPVVDASTLFGSGRLTMYANHDTTAQLLSVIIENGEGGLIVVDGGWTDNAESLLTQIKAKGGHVSAWLITHPDSDHAGALADILYKHPGEITIDGIYYSFLDDSWYAQKDQDVANMVTYLRGAFATLPQTVLHGDIISGQVIEAGPARIQVLNSAYQMNSDFINNSSAAYLVSLNGTNVVFLGDLGRAGGERLMAEHDLSALKCDLVQMAHHGQNGVDYEVYKALRPSGCLWPTPQWLWDNDNGGGAGSGSWKTLETRNWMVRLGVDNHYITKDGDQVLE